eukprot:scaffold11872_cov53-Attheya_sp.AAC.1
MCSDDPTAAFTEWDTKAGLAEFLSSLGVISCVRQGIVDKLVEEGFGSYAALLAAEDGGIIPLGLPTGTLRLIQKFIKSVKEEVNENKEEVEITLEYGRATKEIRALKSDVTLQSLSNTVKNTWKVFKVADFQLVVEDVVGLSNNSISQLKFPVTVIVENLRKGFSDFNDEEAYSYAGVNSTVADKSQFPPPVDVDPNDKWFLHVVDDLTIKHQVFGALYEGCKYMRWEFISAMMILSANLAGVNLAVKENVEGQLAEGPVDWVALYQSYWICITEGKKDNLSNGVVQNIAQLAATRECRNPMRKFSPSIPSYGIATMYHKWVFLKLTDEPRQLFQSTKDSIIIDQNNLGPTLQAVVAQIVAIFTDQKKKIDSQESHGGTKKRKGEKIIPIDDSRNQLAHKINQSWVANFFGEANLIWRRYFFLHKLDARTQSFLSSKMAIGAV